MNSLKPAFTPFHAPAGLKRLLVVVLAVLLLGVFTALPALASGSGTWTLTGSLNVARTDHTATLLQNGQVLVAGSIYTASAELYNPSTGVWTTTGSMHSERWFFTATLLSNGQVLVAGGESYVNNQIVALASAELYNPGTGTWTTTGSMHTAREVHTATLLQNGQVLVAGGGGNTGILASAELYNPGTGTWTVTGSLNVGRDFHTATLLPNGQVLVAGGLNSGCCDTASAELYTPSTGTWTTTGSLHTARDSHTATLLQNGQVLVAGGLGFDYLTSAELYTPSTGTWTLTGSMHTARTLHTATLLSNGQVLVAGGQPSQDYGCPNDTASAELYNPGTGAWSTTGSLNQARERQTATLLTNGQVLVAGGEYNEPDCVSDTFLTSAELYTP
jgi:N-acetylneuraminic acid mutarotase